MSNTYVIDGVTYVGVERRANAGDKVLVIEDFAYGYEGEVHTIKRTNWALKAYETDQAPVMNFNRCVVLEPQEEVTVDTSQASEQVIEMLANLARRVTQLESQLAATQRNLETWAEQTEEVKHMAYTLDKAVMDLENGKSPESEWFTFGEMLDRIQVGDNAIPNDKAYGTITRTPVGLRYVDRFTGETWDSFVSITHSLFNLKYRIVFGGGDR